ncbi:unnamed protein product [Sphagnum jensenii]|uniref:Uncharacterized protein n=1 Tax=Sphagnum jensenii TaxID=128206 RepID=A0ABP0VFX0_9BRYO
MRVQRVSRWHERGRAAEAVPGLLSSRKAPAVRAAAAPSRAKDWASHSACRQWSCMGDPSGSVARRRTPGEEREPDASTPLLSSARGRDRAGSGSKGACDESQQQRQQYSSADFSDSVASYMESLRDNSSCHRRTGSGKTALSPRSAATVCAPVMRPHLLTGPDMAPVNPAPFSSSMSAQVPHLTLPVHPPPSLRVPTSRESTGARDSVEVPSPRSGQSSSNSSGKDWLVGKSFKGSGTGDACKV